MWFLQTNTLLLLTGLGLAFTLAVRLDAKQHRLPLRWLLPIAEVAILFVIDRALALFMILYLLLGYLLAALLARLRQDNLLFGLFCVLAAVPLVLSRTSLSVPAGMFVGMAFHMLKLIDVFYYVHYGKTRIVFLTYLNYMLFLPVFTAGPVFRYRDFAPALDNLQPVTMDMLSDIVKRVIRGLFKKVVLAALVLQLYGHLRALTPALPYSLAIILCSYLLLYLDLSGYSDIAIGYSRLCGITAPENFKQPWNAPTLTQFWRSWHVTVSDFIREHIYVVAAKKKLGRLASGMIGLGTMIVMALWHDFSLVYLAAGVYNGLLLLGENLFSLTTLNRRKANPVHYRLRCLLTNVLFALNTLVFTLNPEEILPVLKGVFRLP